jgi:hypothetical protein
MKNRWHPHTRRCATLAGIAFFVTCLGIAISPTEESRHMRESMCYSLSKLVNDPETFQIILDDTDGSPLVTGATDGREECYITPPRAFDRQYVDM